MFVTVALRSPKPPVWVRIPVVLPFFLFVSFITYGWISKSGSKEAVCKTVGSRLRWFKSSSTHHAWIAQLVERAVETRGSQIRFLLQAP